MSIVKWVGGKSKILNKFIDEIPDTGNIYYEPFIGSASVLIKVLETKKYNHYIVGDVNKPLICLYGMIKTNVKELLNKLEEITIDYENSDNKEEFYYFIRQSFNKKISQIIKDNEFLIDMSSEFIFLNKTCFRGLYRVNKSGEFNVPYGNYKNPCIYDKDEILKLHKLFQNVEFKNKDYKKLLRDVKSNDFIYFDPPYINTFDSYSVESFDSNEFANYVNNISCKCLISNSEDFSEYLSEKFTIKTIQIQDKINSKSPGSVRYEIIAKNF